MLGITITIDVYKTKRTNGPKKATVQSNVTSIQSDHLLNQVAHFYKCIKISNTILSDSE
jgi:hypothetical protein